MTILERLLSSATYAPDGDGAAAQPAVQPAEPSAPEGGEAPEGEAAGPTIKDFFEFDPFEPPEGGQDKAAPAAKAAPAKPASAGEPKTAGDALPPSNQPAAEPKDDPVLRELAKINETLATQPKPQPQAGEPKAKGPKFDFDIPAGIAKALLTSEDPEERAQGLRAFGNGLANAIYQEVSQEYQGHLQTLIQQLPNYFQRMNTEVSQQQKAATDFFGRFSNLKQSPEMSSFVAAQAKALATELYQGGQRNLSWDESFREKLGQRIHDALGLPFPVQGAVPPAKAPNGKAPKSPQFSTGVGARAPDLSANLSETAKEIMDTFS